MWYLKKHVPHRTNILSNLSNLGRRMIVEELHWGENIVLKGEYFRDTCIYEDVFVFVCTSN